MTFLNLHFLPPLIPFTESLQINSDLDHPSHIILSNHSNENTCPFFFQFSEADQRLHDFYQKGICDFYGKITETYMSLPLCPSLNDPTIFKPVIKQIQEILALKRVILDSTLKINKNSSIQISISTSLEELFKHIDHLSSQNKLTESNLNSIFHVLEIYLIGSSVLPLIGKDALEAITIHYFGHLYTENQIKEWFTEMSHLQQFFSNTGNDLDTRILISNSRIESVSALCDVFLKFLYQKIPKLAFVHIQKFFPRDKNQNDILSSYLLSSKAIKNRVRVHDEYSTFALLALNTNSLPIDLNCVGSHFNQDTNEYKPTLEFPNLTSLNSLSIPLKQFLNSDLSAENFAFFSHPFGIQSLLDLLFNCATPTTYNHFGWRYFLRKYNRMMDSNDEKKMVESVLEFRSKNEFMLISKHKFIPIDSDIQTLGGFIYLLLANEFIKVESETLKDPFILSEYLFRACLSLSTYSDMNDQDFLKLWECVDQYYWKPLKRSAKNESIFYSIKIAILNDHIPFSVLSAYINILAYLWHPNSATTHCHAPVIDLKTPFSVFLPIHLQADCELLQKYFEKYVFPSSLKNIYASFTLSSERSLINFPLTPFFNQLKINSSNLKKTVEKLLKGKNSTLKLIGLELYLTFYSLAPDPTFLFYEVFFDFYSIFSEMKSKQQKFAIIQSLKANTDNFPEAISLIEKLLPYPFITSHQNQWIDFLLETNTQYSLDILYKGFIKNKSLFLNCESKTLIKFFQNLLPINYQQAIHVFHWLMSHQQINPNKVLIEQLIHLLIYYENLSSSLKTQFQPYVIRNLNSFFDVDQELIKFKENHPTKFSKSLFGFLTHLFNHAFYETDGDYFLLESCRRNYLTRVHRQSLWIKRINQVIQQSRTQYGAILYLLSVQNKWILPEKFIKTNQTTIGLNLVKALMKENQSPFAKTLLEFLIEKSDIKQFSSITEAIFRSFIQNKSIKFNKENKEILFFLLQTIPMDAQKNASSLLLQSFKDTINLIELNEINSETTSALISLDHLFEQAELIHYIKLLPVEWRDFLLDYLKLTTKIATKERENQLWNIFEEALRLFKRNNKYNRFKLFDQLENLLTFSTPSKNILDWIVNNLEMIFKEVEKKQKINSLKILIKFCHQQGLNLKNYEPYVWKVCINDDQLKISDNEIYSAFQSLDPFSTINCIQIEHYRIFFHVIHHLIIKNSEKTLCLTLFIN
ncbi:MAG: hypothetical protein Q8K60_05050 [Parachlamydiaceae bacterium]|nr:hypothetical protein [Parachlamydiaceae bacterium]